MTAMLIEPEQLLAGYDAVVIDCRFSLADPLEGRTQYEQGHIPGAYYLDLNRDMAGPVGRHGGRHPLPDPAVFAATLERLGVGSDTSVVAYDDSRFAFAARLWWLMRALGYKPPRLLNGGYQAFLAADGRPEEGARDSAARIASTHVTAAAAASARTPAATLAATTAVSPRTSGQTAAPDSVARFEGYCDIDGVRAAQSAGALLIDSREPRRFAGLEEPIDLIAGHIPGAVNRPWQHVTDAAGRVVDSDALRAHWGDALDTRELVVYCGSGVTACVNLFSLALLGREDATLYAGSWSDWCSYL